MEWNLDSNLFLLLQSAKHRRQVPRVHCTEQSFISFRLLNIHQSKIMIYFHFTQTISKSKQTQHFIVKLCNNVTHLFRHWIEAMPRLRQTKESLPLCVCGKRLQASERWIRSSTMWIFQTLNLNQFLCKLSQRFCFEIKSLCHLCQPSSTNYIGLCEMK